ncbi:hypothetical protein E4U43_007285 [Claviceps pusilla]|uniref:Glycosyl transferase CAP10 domain-containing protein n=1 Tax=Claviceps pusilla TaxID=123648 RepID=A0A9P7SZ81_9HYPO|nr:hypothetical protein E4U43_007285 [Claviceps pusilla]
MGRFSPRRRSLPLLAVFASLLLLYHFSRTSSRPEHDPRPAVSGPQHDEDLNDYDNEIHLPGYLTRPRSRPRTESHPIEYLSQTAEHEFHATLNRQSKTLEEAVREYRRRYGLHPPPNFDKWFAFAKENEVQLIDEFDTIHELMTPFWGLNPKTIRSRAREALGRDNGLMGIAIREHKVAFVQNPHGPEWQQVATTDMMAKFIQYLPDMDLAFNIHDEPRVVLQHDDLARLVHKAQTGDMAASFANQRPVNGFATRVPDLARGSAFVETKQTRFRSAAHQPTWTTSRMSCSPDSPARILEETDLGDDAEKYALTEAGFVTNATALADICLSPSLSHSYGFFEMPNGYIIAHDLFPIFSQSKISSYNDIIYPSPWYWSEKVVYNDTKDRLWADKDDQLYWRGSTTGGFSRGGNWRRQHRQLLVRKLNHVSTADILTQDPNPQQPNSDADPNWAVKQINRSDVDSLLNVRFSHVGQCDPDDCQAQIKYFGVKDMVDMQDAWQYKFLLDMDGNAFSGRFYAFLQSRSQVFKQALFQEWHREWLKPWVHYVPMSMRGHDWVELVRFYSAGGGSGDDGSDAGPADQHDRAEGMARASTEWAGKVLRKVDMEAWFFRLLLE